MADPADRLEVEIKYRLPDAAGHERLRQRLAALGARPAPVEHELNVLFDSEGGGLGQRRAILRIRSINGGAGGTLTYKGAPTQTNGVKSRAEIEVVVADAAAMQALLAALGYKPMNSYRKRRESWHLDNVEVSLDTTRIGYFCEIEGPHAQILALGRRLGLSDDQVELAGYAELLIQPAGAGTTV
ncbi:MAG: class IV adenylate cyclase [Chloroflexota bacterium]|nr:class IV adenylate cyclase [Chloroflexota bacterium]